MANSVDPDQTAPIGAVCSGSTLFASILKFGSNIRQLFAADDINRCIFFLALKGLNRVLLSLSKGPYYKPHFEKKISLFSSKF